MGALSHGAPIVELAMPSGIVKFDNPYLYAYLERAKTLGGLVRVYSSDPLRIAILGQDSGDSPTPTVYGWMVDPYLSVKPDEQITIPSGGCWIKYFHPDDPVTRIPTYSDGYTFFDVGADMPGGTFTFIRIGATGESYGYGGNVKNDTDAQFWGGFAKGAIVWGAVVAATVYTAGAVSDFGVSGALSGGVVPTTTTPYALTPAITVAETVPAFVGPLEVVSTPFTLASVTAGAKSVSATVGAVTGAASAVGSAVASIKSIVSGGANTPTLPQDDAPVNGDGSVPMVLAAVAALLFLG